MNNDNNRPPASLWSIAVTRNKNIINSGVLFIALQRAALTSSRQLRYEQAKHVDGLQ